MGFTDLANMFQHPRDRLSIYQMDPRPYTYEYRKPRPSNPTYLSYNAYQSLYHMGKLYAQPHSDHLYRGYSPSKNTAYPPNYSDPYSNPIPQYNRYEVPHASHYESVVPVKKYESTAVNTDRFSNRVSSNLSQRSRGSSVSAGSNNQPPGRSSVLSNYGSNSLERNGAGQKGSRGKQVASRKREDSSGRGEVREVNVVYPTYAQSSKVYEKQQRPFDIITLYSKPNQPLRKYPKITLQHLILEKGMDIPT